MYTAQNAANARRIQEILNTMDIPEKRKNDWGWIRRNIGIQNQSHPDLNELLSLIKKEGNQS